MKVNENSSLENIAKIFAQLDGQSRLIVEPWRKEAELLLESRQVSKSSGAAGFCPQHCDQMLSLFT